MRFHLVELWAPHGREWCLVRTEKRRTLARAIRRAEQILAGHRVVTTAGTYHRDTGRAFGCAIRRNGLEIAIVDAPVTIVPSVGELGWTP